MKCDLYFILLLVKTLNDNLKYFVERERGADLPNLNAIIFN